MITFIIEVAGRQEQRRFYHEADSWRAACEAFRNFCKLYNVCLFDVFVDVVLLFCFSSIVMSYIMTKT